MYSICLKRFVATNGPFIFFFLNLVFWFSVCLVCGFNMSETVCSHKWDFENFFFLNLVFWFSVCFVWFGMFGFLNEKVC